MFNANIISNIANEMHYENASNYACSFYGINMYKESPLDRQKASGKMRLNA